MVKKLNLLVELQLIDRACCVSDAYFAEVLFKFNFHGAVWDIAAKLVEVDVNLHFCIFIRPTELLNFL